jgi:hypothetical protein
MKDRRPVLHPFLFSLYAVLSLLAFNIDQLDPGQSLRSIILALICTALLVLLGRVIFRDWVKAGLFGSLVVVLFFSYGHVYHLLEGKGIGSFTLGRHRFLVIVWVLAFMLGAFYIWRRSDRSPSLTNALNLVAAITLIFPIVNIATHVVRASRAESRLASQESITSISKLGISNQDLPDVYYIILDAYGREDMLNDVYDFDNHEFLDQLEEIGFYIADESNSNYTQTSLSVASSLNLDYVQNIIPSIDPSSDDLTPLGAAIKHSTVRDFFEELGYTIIAFGTGFSRTEIEDADYYLTLNPEAMKSMKTFGSINMFEGMLIQTSAAVLAADVMQLLPEAMQPDLEFPYRAHRERILFAFDEVAELPDADSPRFVFIHIVSPHPPFVFGPNGEDTKHSEAYTLKNGVFLGQRNEYVRLYTDQLKYLNARTLTAIRQIIANAERPVVILLQSDHGADASALPGEDELGISYLQERMSILNAYYMPDCEGDSALYPSITPVNSFRAIFNACFGTEYELLKDRLYNSSYGAPYALIDWTDKIR